MLMAIVSDRLHFSWWFPCLVFLCLTTPCLYANTSPHSSQTYLAFFGLGSIFTVDLSRRRKCLIDKYNLLWKPGCSSTFWMASHTLIGGSIESTLGLRLPASSLVPTQTRATIEGWGLCVCSVVFSIDFTALLRSKPMSNNILTAFVRNVSDS